MSTTTPLTKKEKAALDHVHQNGGELAEAFAYAAHTKKVMLALVAKGELVHLSMPRIFKVKR